MNNKNIIHFYLYINTMKKIALITSVIIIFTLIYLNLSLETNYITNDNTFRVEYKNINSITNNKKNI